MIGDLLGMLAAPLAIPILLIIYLTMAAFIRM